MKAITKADRDALARLPEGCWFFIDQVSYMVRNPRWRCDRLTDFGLLESEVVKQRYESIPGAFGYVPRFRKARHPGASEGESK